MKKMKKLILTISLALASTNSFSSDVQGPAADCDQEYHGAKYFGCCYKPSWGFGYEQWVGSKVPIQRTMDLSILCFSKSAVGNRWCTLDGSPIYGTKSEELPSSNCKARGVVPFGRWITEENVNPDYQTYNTLIKAKVEPDEPNEPDEPDCK